MAAGLSPQVQADERRHGGREEPVEGAGTVFEGRVPEERELRLVPDLDVGERASRLAGVPLHEALHGAGDRRGEHVGVLGAYVRDTIREGPIAQRAPGGAVHGQRPRHGVDREERRGSEARGDVDGAACIGEVVACVVDGIGEGDHVAVVDEPVARGDQIEVGGSGGRGCEGRRQRAGRAVGQPGEHAGRGFPAPEADPPVGTDESRRGGRGDEARYRVVGEEGAGEVVVA
jgi:hypothetical protein